MKKCLLFSFLILFIFSCDRKKDIDDPISDQLEDAVLLDFIGLDGCTWIIQLPDGANLEPINLSDFDILPVNEKEVLISYVTRPDMASACMVGTIIELEHIEAK